MSAVMTFGYICWKSLNLMLSPCVHLQKLCLTTESVFAEFQVYLQVFIQLQAVKGVSSKQHVGFIDYWKTYWRRPGLIIRGNIHHTWELVNLDGSVRNLGVISDQELSFNSHVKQISRTAFFHLRNIAQIQHILS